jgi:hypothetical protein
MDIGTSHKLAPIFSFQSFTHTGFLLALPVLFPPCPMGGGWGTNFPPHLHNSGMKVKVLKICMSFTFASRNYISNGKVISLHASE